MGLNSGNPILDMFSNILKDGLAQENSIISKPEPINIKEYFKQNTINGDELKDEDLITVSLSENNGYRAVFVKLGDLKKFLRS